MRFKNVHQRGSSSVAQRLPINLLKPIVAYIFSVLYLVTAAFADPAVKVATIHFAPILGDVAGNRTKLVGLSSEAARNGAKIIVNTEMATAGYAYFSRFEISKVAEPIPGPTTKAIGEIARRYGAYIVVGLPEVDPVTNQYFNAAALIGKDGEVKGKYRKRNNLIEASYNATATGPIPTFDTEYGRIAVAICADLFYPEIPRLAAVAGAQLLLVPANVGVDIDLLRLRATENDFAVIIANRYGKEGSGSKSENFSEDTFSIPSPFPLDFNQGTRSAVISSEGQVVTEFSDPKDRVIYAELPLQTEHAFPIIRRPDLYSLMSQDTLEPYTFRQLRLPQAAEVAVAATDPGSSNRNLMGVEKSVYAAVKTARRNGLDLRLVVLPSGMFFETDEPTVAELRRIADRGDVDLVVGFDSDAKAKRPISLFVAGDDGSSEVFRYHRTHRQRNEDAYVGDDFLVLDRQYGRVAVLQGPDLLAPETTVVMAKMGVDIVAVSANMTGDNLNALWRTRSGDYLHVVLANGNGSEGIYLGGYKRSPSEMTGEGEVLMLTNTADVRDKKEPRHIDLTPLLVRCRDSLC
jgi:predicted amidohydrolase